MTVYAVFKHGVYRHECGGVFSTLDGAVTAAEQLKAGELDRYHGYRVVPFELDEVTEHGVLNEEDFGGWKRFYLKEPHAVRIIDRG